MYKLFLLEILVLSFTTPYVLAGEDPTQTCDNGDIIPIEDSCPDPQYSPAAGASILLPILVIGGAAAAATAGGVIYKLRSKFYSMKYSGQEDMALPFSSQGPDVYREETEVENDPTQLKFLLDTTIKKDSRKINIWIKNHDSKQPLTLDWYELNLNVGKELANVIVSTSAEALEKVLEVEEYPEIKILLVSDSFEIPEKSNKFLLPPQGNSDTLSFKIKPIKLGNQSIEVFFYYKLNLLQVLSVTLNVKPKLEISSKTSTDSSFLGTEILASSMNGLYSISEIIEDEK